MTLKLIKNGKTTSLAAELMTSSRFQMFVQRLARAQAIAEAGERIKETADRKSVAAEHRKRRRRRNASEVSTS